MQGFLQLRPVQIGRGIDDGLNEKISLFTDNYFEEKVAKSFYEKI